ncbi:MAG TPA: hypothetical protein VK468_02420 [Pyrinomonadaceae bacterium]|nr:hypothetical protein [Pyrinomonadaceae bacterium]
MSKHNGPLDNLKIASPCSAAWNEMYGTDRKRFCGECKLNVYNLSGMTRDDAEQLLESSEGRLCVRYYRRADGTILTADCPVGWAKVRQRLSVYTTAAFSLLISLITGLFFVSLLRRSSVEARRIPYVFAAPTPEPLMGEIAVSPTPKPKTEAERDWVLGKPIAPKQSENNGDIEKQIKKLAIASGQAN